MIQIQNISVRNFKNIESADLDLNPINVIIGPNGSGKTNFLMIPAFLRFVLRGSSEKVEELFEKGHDLKFGSILPGQSQEEKMCLIEVSLIDHVTNVFYKYSLTISRVEPENKRLKISHEEFLFKKKSSTGLPTTILVREGRKLTLHKKIRRLLPNLELPEYLSSIRPLELIQGNLEDSFKTALFSLFSVLETPTIYFTPSSLKSDSIQNRQFFEHRLTELDIRNGILLLDTTNRLKHFKTILKSIIDLEDVVIIKTSEMDNEFKLVAFVFAKHLNLIHELSDGIVLMIGLVLKIMISEKSIMFIEELENSLHPKALDGFVSFIRQSSVNKQFVISTHSSGLINLVKPDEVFVSNINANGLSSFAPIANIKEVKNKLAKSFISFGDLIFQHEENPNEFEDIF